MRRRRSSRAARVPLLCGIRCWGGDIRPTLPICRLNRGQSTRVGRSTGVAQGRFRWDASFIAVGPPTPACFIDAVLPLQHVARDRPLFEAGVSPIPEPVLKAEFGRRIGVGGARTPHYSTHFSRARSDLLARKEVMIGGWGNRTPVHLLKTWGKMPTSAKAQRHAQYDLHRKAFRSPISAMARPWSADPTCDTWSRLGRPFPTP
jgi:hypothetical protein